MFRGNLSVPTSSNEESKTSCTTCSLKTGPVSCNETSIIINLHFVTLLKGEYLTSKLEAASHAYIHKFKDLESYTPAMLMYILIHNIADVN
jgi:hypothetical protein